MKTSVINYSMSRQKGLRFDASFYLSDGLTARRKVESSPYGCLLYTSDAADE